MATVQSSQAHVVSKKTLEPDYTWSFSPVVREYDPSLLVQLYAALNLNVDGDISAYDIPPPATELTPADIRTVSLEQVETFGGNSAKVPWHSKQAPVDDTEVIKELEHSSQGRQILRLYDSRANNTHVSSKKRTATGAFKCPGMDVLFPCEKVIWISPLDVELYPFPPFQESQV